MKLNKIATAVKISVTSKLDGIRSWSLQALDTCPGSIESPGVLVDACKGGQLGKEGEGEGGYIGLGELWVGLAVP